MQEYRRIFEYLDKEDIPASAIEVNKSGRSIHGNVLYIPVYHDQSSYNYKDSDDKTYRVAMSAYSTSLGANLLGDWGFSYTYGSTDNYTTTRNVPKYIATATTSSSFMFIFKNYIILTPAYQYGIIEPNSTIPLAPAIAKYEHGLLYSMFMYPNGYLKLKFDSDICVFEVYGVDTTMKVYSSRNPKVLSGLKYPIYIDTE